MSGEPFDSEGGGRGLRADARRNRQRVIDAAQQLFASRGLDTPLDEIAAEAGVGPGTVHRHFPSKDGLYLAVATDMLKRIIDHADSLVAGDDATSLFTLMASMMASGAENAAVKSALEAAEFDLRTTAPGIAAGLTGRVAELLTRAQDAGVARGDVTVDDVMAVVAGAFAAIRHAGVDTSPERSARLAEIIIDSLRISPTRI